MGNTTSCGCIKVVTTSTTGVLNKYTRPVSAGELMLENPGEFVCDSGHLTVGCRIPGLAADEELKPNRLYFLLPMDLLFSVLTEEEKAVLSRRATRALRKGSASKNIKRIFPVLLGDSCLFPAVAKEAEQEMPVRSGAVDDAGDVLRWQRSWRPALDTIEEVW